MKTFDAVANFIFGDEAPAAFPFHTGSGEIILDAGNVRVGDMIHRDVEGRIRVLRPISAKTA